MRTYIVYVRGIVAFLVLVFLLMAVVTCAQVPRSAKPATAKAPVVIVEKEAEIRLHILPLDTLLAKAERNSPALKMQQALMYKNEYLIRSQKQQWQDALATDITGGFGNQSLLVQQPTGEITQFDNFNNGYRVGATLRLSMYDLFGRRSEVKMAVQEYEVSRYKKQVLAQEMTGQITELYYHLIAAESILKIKSDAKQATSINRLMAEKEFNEGNIPVAELSRIIEISAKAATEYELAKKDLYATMRLLETMVGEKLFF